MGAGLCPARKELSSLFDDGRCAVFVLAGPQPMLSITVQMEPAIYDESRVPRYTLPDPLQFADGGPVTAPGQWAARRAELVELLSRHQYGFAPSAAVEWGYEVVAEDRLGEAITLKQADLVLRHRGRRLRLELMLLLPSRAAGPVPAFLGLNFYGNHTVHPDPRIRLHASWSPNSDELGITANAATVASRGLRAYRWPAERVLSSGNALVTAYSGDIDPDFDDGFRNGVHGLFDGTDFAVPPAERWGTIAAWAWGMSRILDCIIGCETAIDADRVVAIGHSRMGKAALWAAASDTRFAAVVSNDSGCAGAALHRRRFGERLVHLNTTFPHWLCGTAKAYNEREADLPFDQHQLLCLIAPRPVYVASAAEDLWADPKGEFLSLLHAEEVYRLLGYESHLPREQPPAGCAIDGRLGYHMRPGKHDILSSDWEHYLGFADRWVRHASA